jgi:serine/threonine-protein kinase RsbW
MQIPCAVVARNANGEPSVSLRGDVDFHNARVVREAVHLAARQHGDAIVVDLAGVAFIDSSGLSTLVVAARDLREQGRWLRLERASRHLVQLLQTAGFSRYFQVESLLTPGGLPPALAARDGAPPNGAPADGGTTAPPPTGKIWQHAAFSIPARANLVSHIRSRITDMVESVPLAEEYLDGIRLAVGEAASNAVRHGCGGNEDLKVKVECSTDGHTLVVEISDPGPGFDPDAVPVPRAGELQEGGMGIHFMRLTMDEVTYHFNGNGTKVRLVKSLSLRCEPAGGAPPRSGGPGLATAQSNGGSAVAEPGSRVQPDE